MTGDLTPAPQMPEDVADRHSDRRRNVIINHTSTDLENIVNGHDPDIHHLGNRVWDRLDKMAVEIERHAIEAQAAENADLRAKLAEVTALLADAYGAEIDWDALLQERGAGTFAQGIEAAAQTLEERGSDGWAEYAMSEYASVCCEAIRALTPPVDVRETPIRCHQYGLTTVDEQQAPQADPVREAADNMMPGAIEALAAYQQADMDGIMVLVSRQAIEECLPVLRAVARMETTHD